MKTKMRGRTKLNVLRKSVFFSPLFLKITVKIFPKISLLFLIPADTDGLSAAEIIKSHMALKHGERDYSVSEETLESWRH